MNKTLFSAIGVACLIAGCSGGGGGSSGATGAGGTPLVGLYEGTASNGRRVAAVVTADGKIYAMYLAQGSGAAAGIVHGNVTSNGSTFAGQSVVDYNMEGLGVTPVTLTGSYTPKTLVTGTITAPGSTPVTFSLTYNSSWETAPSLATLAGDYYGWAATTAPNSEVGGYTVPSSGTFSTKFSSGCAAQATLTPRSDGNLFDATVSFGGSPCLFPNSQVTGVAYYDSATGQAYLALPKPSSNGAVMSVTKKLTRFPMTTTNLSLVSTVGESTTHDYLYAGTSLKMVSTGVVPTELHPFGVTFKTSTTIKNLQGTTLNSILTTDVYLNGCLGNWINQDGGHAYPSSINAIAAGFACDGLAVGDSKSFADAVYQTGNVDTTGIKVSATYLVQAKEFVLTPLGAIEAFKIAFSEQVKTTTVGTTAFPSITDLLGSTCLKSASTTYNLGDQTGTLWFSPVNGVVRREFTQTIIPCFGSSIFADGQLVLETSTIPVK